MGFGFGSLLNNFYIWVLPALFLILIFYISTGADANAGSNSLNVGPTLTVNSKLLVFSQATLLMLFSSMRWSGITVFSLHVSAQSIVWANFIICWFLLISVIIFVGRYAPLVQTNSSLLPITVLFFTLLWLLLGLSSSYLVFFLIIELIAFTLIGLFLNLNYDKGTQFFGNYSQLRSILFLLWTNAISFMFFFLSLGIITAFGVNIDWSHFALFSQLSYNSSFILNHSTLISVFLLTSVFTKLLMPPMQFILALVYRNFNLATLTLYFSLYYSPLLISVLFVFFYLFSSLACGWVFFILSGAVFAVMSLSQISNMSGDLQTFLALSTSFNLSILFFACAVA